MSNSKSSQLKMPAADKPFSTKTSSTSTVIPHPTFFQNVHKNNVEPADMAASPFVQFKVKRALAQISSIKESVLRLRFGLNGQAPKSCDEVAKELTAALSPAQRWVLARHKGILPECVVITAEDVEELEVQALRDIRPSNRMRFRGNPGDN